MRSKPHPAWHFARRLVTGSGCHVATDRSLEATSRMKPFQFEWVLRSMKMKLCDMQMYSFWMNILVELNDSFFFIIIFRSILTAKGSNKLNAWCLSRTPSKQLFKATVAYGDETDGLWKTPFESLFREKRGSISCISAHWKRMCSLLCQTLFNAHSAPSRRSIKCWTLIWELGWIPYCQRVVYSVSSDVNALSICLSGYENSRFIMSILPSRWMLVGFWKKLKKGRQRLAALIITNFYSSAVSVGALVGLQWSVNQGVAGWSAPWDKTCAAEGWIGCMCCLVERDLTQLLNVGQKSFRTAPPPTPLLSFLSHIPSSLSRSFAFCALPTSLFSFVFLSFFLAVFFWDCRSIIALPPFLSPLSPSSVMPLYQHSVFYKNKN